MATLFVATRSGFGLPVLERGEVRSRALRPLFFLKISFASIGLFTHLLRDFVVHNIVT